jgi:hypothetical protein
VTPSFWRLLFGLALLGSLSFEIIGEKRPVEHVWDYPLFFAVAGALGCLLLIVLAKGVVSPSIDRAEDFYSEEDAEGDWSRESPAAAQEAGKPFPVGEEG